MNGLIQYGQKISLFHGKTDGTLACDPSEHMISVCKSLEPIARNTFIFLPTEENSNIGNANEKKKYVCWGVPFQLACCPEVVQSNNELSIHESNMSRKEDSLLYLASTLKTEHRVSPISCEQLVNLSSDSNFNTFWVAQIPARTKGSGIARFMNQGTPILAQENIVIQHCATQTFLSSDIQFPIRTDFGREYEVSCCTKYRHGRVNILQEEFHGTKTKSTICRPEQVQNIWSLVILSSKGESGNDNNHPMSTPMISLQRLRNSLKHKHGIFSLRKLNCSLIRQSLLNNAVLTFAEFKKILLDMSIYLETEECNVIMKKHMLNEFDIHVFALVSDLRKMLSPNRREKIEQTYKEILQSNCCNALNEHIICKAHDNIQKHGLDNIDIDSLMELWEWDEYQQVSKDGKELIANFLFITIFWKM